MLVNETDGNINDASVFIQAAIFFSASSCGRTLENAREVPLFEPLVVKAEQDIARLRVPTPHLYELTKEAGQ